MLTQFNKLFTGHFDLIFVKTNKKVRPETLGIEICPFSSQDLQHPEDPRPPNNALTDFEMVADDIMMV